MTSTNDIHIRFWCDSDITFLTWLQYKFVTVLYFSIIDVFWLRNLCGAGGVYITS